MKGGGEEIKYEKLSGCAKRRAMLRCIQKRIQQIHPLEVARGKNTKRHEKTLECLLLQQARQAHEDATSRVNNC